MVKVQWLGHAGWRIETQHEDKTYVIYVDTWLGNPKLPEAFKGVVPDDADLILVTHGHYDHSASAPDLCKASKKESCKIVCIYEVGEWYKNVQKVDSLMQMNKSGTADLGWCKVTMVGADHSSGCPMSDGHIFDGGAAAGYVIRFPGCDTSIYHAGDTGIFLDMQLISELYKPTHLMLPIGGNFTMGPEEAAHCLQYFTHARAVIPMHFGTFPLLPGTFPEFKEHCEKKGTKLRVYNSYEECLGKVIEL